MSNQVAGSATHRESKKTLVSIVMGSQSDWETMQHARNILQLFDISHECLVVSAHRTPQWLIEFSRSADERRLRAVIAGAGGAAHLPGMVAAQTLVPVFGVPIKSNALKGMDSLLSIVQMPAGVPVGTLAIGKAGAINAALLSVAVIATTDDVVRKKLADYREEQTELVLQKRHLDL